MLLISCVSTCELTRILYFPPVLHHVTLDYWFGSMRFCAAFSQSRYVPERKAHTNNTHVLVELHAVVFVRGVIFLEVSTFAIKDEIHTIDILYIYIHELIIHDQHRHRFNPKFQAKAQQFVAESCCYYYSANLTCCGASCERVKEVKQQLAAESVVGGSCAQEETGARSALLVVDHGPLCFSASTNQ